MKEEADKETKRILNANDIELLEKATRYKLNSIVKKRIMKLLETEPEDEKLNAAMNYVHSITKVGVRGTR
jgi:hypothetical protein